MKKSLVFGLFFLLLSLAGLGQTSHFFQAYLFSFLFWSELAFGSLALLMIYHLTGGAWGDTTRGILESAVKTLGVVALLFLPVLSGLKRLYLWTDPAQVAASEKLLHKQLYLNSFTFSLRALFYFVGWLILARVLTHSKDPERLKRWSAGGLVFFGFTISFAAIDWQMSLEPNWYSTVYGMVFATGQALGAWAFALLVFSFLAAPAAKKTLLDQANILLALIMLWAYLSFMQYLIIWSGNLPEEVTWVKHRTENGSKWLAYALILFQFAAPFSLLLFREIKSRKKSMLLICTMILAIRVVDRYWFVMPTFSWMDLTLLLGIGGIWIAAFLFAFNRRAVSYG